MQDYETKSNNQESGKLNEKKPIGSDKAQSTNRQFNTGESVTQINVTKSISKMLVKKAAAAKSPEETRAYLEMEEKYSNTRYKRTLSICCFLTGVIFQVLNISPAAFVSGITIGQFLIGVGLAGLGIDYVFKKG